MKPIVTDAYDFPTLIRNGRVYPGMRALSPEMAMEDRRNRDRGHADGPTVEVLVVRGRKI